MIVYILYVVVKVDVNWRGTVLNVTVKWDVRGSAPGLTLGFRIKETD